MSKKKKKKNQKKLTRKDLHTSWSWCDQHASGGPKGFPLKNFDDPFGKQRTTCWAVHPSLKHQVVGAGLRASGTCSSRVCSIPRGRYMTSRLWCNHRFLQWCYTGPAFKNKEPRKKKIKGNIKEQTEGKDQIKPFHCFSGSLWKCGAKLLFVLVRDFWDTNRSVLALFNVRVRPEWRPVRLDRIVPFSSSTHCSLENLRHFENTALNHLICNNRNRISFTALHPIMPKQTNKIEPSQKNIVILQVPGKPSERTPEAQRRRLERISNAYEGSYSQGTILLQAIRLNAKRPMNERMIGKRIPLSWLISAWECLLCSLN